MNMLIQRIMNVRIQLGLVIVIVVLLLLQEPLKVVEYVPKFTQWVGSYQPIGMERGRSGEAKTISKEHFLRNRSWKPAEALIRGTSLKTTEAVEKFKSHLSCFSESGTWAAYPHPQPNFCKVNTTPHIYCNDASMVIRSFEGFDLEFAELQDGRFSDRRKHMSWLWHTNESCPFVSLDRMDACRLLVSKGNLLILGDSISYQIFTTFLNFLRIGYSHHVHSDHRFGQEEICGDVPSVNNRRGKKTITIGWVWNPFLQLNETVQYLEEWNINTLLFNTGAKFREDNVYQHSIQEFVDVLQARYPHLLVIFRNTPPGHTNCQDYRGPIALPQEKERLIYHWGEFARQNQLAREIIEKARYVYMDVDTMLSLRPDEHMKPPEDCLHYAIPGPLDVVFHLFYNILLLFPYNLASVCAHFLLLCIFTINRQAKFSCILLVCAHFLLLCLFTINREVKFSYILVGKWKKVPTHQRTWHLDTVCKVMKGEISFW